MLHYQDCKKAIAYMRTNFTYLDKLCFTAKNLPSELFYDYDLWVLPLAKSVKKY